MDANERQQYQRNVDHSRRMTEIALRGTALLWDLQADTARSLFEAQARSAVLFGAPDLSRVFENGNGRSKGLFTSAIDQTLDSIRQISDTFSEVQWQLARVTEQQTTSLAERFQQSIGEISRRSQEGLQQIRRIAHEEADEIERAAGEARSREANIRQHEHQSGSGTEGRTAANQAESGSEERGGQHRREGRRAAA